MRTSSRFFIFSLLSLLSLTALAGPAQWMHAGLKAPGLQNSGKGVQSAQIFLAVYLAPEASPISEASPIKNAELLVTEACQDPDEKSKQASASGVCRYSDQSYTVSKSNRSYLITYTPI